MRDIKKFQKTVWDYYNQHKRDFPWRKTKNPYHIWVSEVMLQQTQTDRVVPKYKAFLKRFPTVRALASASQKDVLESWQGLGYNRRGLNLKRAAEEIVGHFKGRIPSKPEALLALPGIGEYTSKAIITFAYNVPLVFIETNIRTVYLEYFFKNSKTQIHDKEILRLVEKTMDIINPREWFYALMDYGVMLKKIHKAKNIKSVHYRKQTPFQGSGRQVRSTILKYILENHKLTLPALCKIPLLKNKKNMVQEKIQELVHEGFIVKDKNYYVIS